MRLMRGDYGLQLAVIAAEIAADMRERIEPLKAEIQEIDDRLAESKEKLRLAVSAADRVDSLNTAERHCPSCWVEREVEHPLDHVSDVPGVHLDTFYCSQCNRNFEL
jgi:predicted  nucleic acid-binding Zn-ribbon protein